MIPEEYLATDRSLVVTSRQMIRNILLIAILSLTSWSVTSFEASADRLDEERRNTIWVSETNNVGMILSVDLFLRDEVSDNCWTNGRAVKARFHSELERAGLPVFDEELALHSVHFPRLVLNAVGYRISGSALCIARTDIRVEFDGSSTFGSLEQTQKVARFAVKAELWRRSTIQSAPSNLNESILSFAQQAIDELVSAIFKARRSEEVSEALQVGNPEHLTNKAMDKLIQEYFSER